jgi:hypothetical protein
LSGLDDSPVQSGPRSPPVEEAKEEYCGEAEPARPPVEVAALAMCRRWTDPTVPTSREPRFPAKGRRADVFVLSVPISEAQRATRTGVGPPSRVLDGPCLGAPLATEGEHLPPAADVRGRAPPEPARFRRASRVKPKRASRLMKGCIIQGYSASGRETAKTCHGRQTTPRWLSSGGHSFSGSPGCTECLHIIT